MLAQGLHCVLEGQEKSKDYFGEFEKSKLNREHRNIDAEGGTEDDGTEKGGTFHTYAATISMGIPSGTLESVNFALHVHKQLGTLQPRDELALRCATNMVGLCVKAWEYGGNGIPWPDCKCATPCLIPASHTKQDMAVYTTVTVNRKTFKVGLLKCEVSSSNERTVTARQISNSAAANLAYVPRTFVLELNKHEAIFYEYERDKDRATVNINSKRFVFVKEKMKLGAFLLQVAEQVVKCIAYTWLHDFPRYSVKVVGHLAKTFDSPHNPPRLNKDGKGVPVNENCWNIPNIDKKLELEKLFKSFDLPEITR